MPNQVVAIKNLFKTAKESGVLILGISFLATVLLLIGSTYFSISTYKIFVREFGQGSDLSVWLTGGQKHFRLDSYEAKTTLATTQAECAAFNDSQITQTELIHRIQGLETQYEHFTNSAKTAPFAAKFDSYPEAIAALRIYLSEVKLFADKKIKFAQLYESYSNAMESWSGFNSEVVQDEYGITDGLVKTVGDFSGLLSTLFLLNIGLIVMCLASALVTLLTAKSYLLKEKERKENITMMIAAIGHDLRSPLQSILNANSLLAKETNLQFKNKYAKIIKSSCKSLSRMIDDFCQVLDVNEISTIEGDVIIQDWFVDLTGYFAEKAKEKGLAFVTSLNADLNVYRFDADRFNQCIGNLINNSIRYTDKGFVGLDINIVAQVQGAGLEMVVKVSDSGIGIPETDIQKIRLPFSRGSNVGKRNGTGLGLSIVSRLTKLVAGQFDIQSKLHAGTVVTLKLPIHAVDNATKRDVTGVPSTSQAVIQAAEYTDYEVLIVEDDKSIREVISSGLTEAGYRVQTAVNGADALSQITSNYFPIILTDIQMPLKDGFDLCAEADLVRVPLRKSYKIAMTAYTKELAANPRAKIFDKVLNKPVDIDAICTEIDTGLDVISKLEKVSL